MKDITTVINESRNRNVQFYADLIHNQQAIKQIINWFQSLDSNTCEGFYIQQEKNQVSLVETDDRGIPTHNRKKIKL